jgi:hypothetical protein
VNDEILCFLSFVVDLLLSVVTRLNQFIKIKQLRKKTNSEFPFYPNSEFRFCIQPGSSHSQVQ